ncbi:hypothetical protein BJ878DRAFT_514269 [Calycina marina]|uniref:Uncharacterized protein n=1 Tax=Calycina marina TaxID=1763456 RepID=A0A9P7YZJ6_9HELO|nr:hypothetical protein BJ878DRAFT_514269 [Calycina marina]
MKLFPCPLWYCLALIQRSLLRCRELLRSYQYAGFYLRKANYRRLSSPNHPTYPNPPDQYYHLHPNLQRRELAQPPAH